VSEGAKFCPECGVALRADDEQPIEVATEVVTTDELPEFIDSSVAEPDAPPESGPGPQLRARRRRWALAFVASVAALLVLVAGLAALSPGGSDTQPDAASAAPQTVKPRSTRPTRYSQLLRVGMSPQKAARPLCVQYSAAIQTWQQALQSRSGALAGIANDPYAAAAFSERAGNGWINANTERAFTRQINGIARVRLRGLAGPRARMITATMNDRFARDSLFVCHVGASIEQLTAKLAALDVRTSDLVDLAAAKPWYPQGYYPAPGEESIAWRWDDNVTGCRDGYSIEGEYCWGMRVIARDGCPSSLYASINIIQGSTVIDFSNDTLNGLEPGQTGELAFKAFENTTATLSGHLKEINCY
jgi:hypothetical protein